MAAPVTLGLNNPWCLLQILNYLCFARKASIHVSPASPDIVAVHQCDPLQLKLSQKPPLAIDLKAFCFFHFVLN
jgi:hypothetical protein